MATITSSITPVVRIISKVTTGGRGDPGAPGAPGQQGPQGVGVPTGGLTGQVLVKQSTADYDIGFEDYESSGGGSAQRKVTQALHNFQVGQILAVAANSEYYLSKADTPSDAEVVGIVSQVNDANTFTVTTEGYVDGLSGLTPGAVYFLHPTTGGSMTTTEPSVAGHIRKPIFVAESATSGYFHNYAGIAVGSAGAGGGSSSAATSSIAFKTVAFTVSNSDDYIIATGGDDGTMQTLTGVVIKPYHISNQDDTQIITLLPNGANTIGGNTSVQIYPGQTITLVPNGTNWVIIR